MPHAMFIMHDSKGNSFEVTAKEILDLAPLAADSEYSRGDSFNDPKDVKRFLIGKLAGFEREVFGCLFLDSKNRLIEYVELFSGSLMQTSVYPREVVKAALQANAASVIFTHNHPGGSSDPSQADKDLTRKLKTALEMVDIRTLDHVIVAGSETYAFSENYLI